MSSYNTDDYSSANNNVDVTNLASAPPASTTVNSLRLNTTPAGTLALGGALTLASGGILVTPTVGANNIAINGGALTSSGTTASDTLADVVVLQGNTLAPLTIGASVTNNGTISVGLTKGGPGMLILAGSNTYSGPTTVSGGTLQGSAGGGSFPTSIAVNAGANVDFVENGALAVTSTIGITGAGTLTKDGSQSLATGGVSLGGLSVLKGTYQVNGSAAISGPASVAAGAALAMGSSLMNVGPLSGSGALNLAGTFTENPASFSEFDGTLAGHGVFLKSGTGTLLLTNSGSTLAGSVRIGAGTLQLSNSLALQTATLDMNAADAGALDTSTYALSGMVLGGLTGARNLSTPAGPLTVGGNNSSTTFSGNLSGAVALSKVGSGTLFLSGATSLAGATILAGGLEVATTASLPAYSTSAPSALSLGPALPCRRAMARAVGTPARSAACWPAAVGRAPRSSASIPPAAMRCMGTTSACRWHWPSWGPTT